MGFKTLGAWFPPGASAPAQPCSTTVMCSDRHWNPVTHQVQFLLICPVQRSPKPKQQAKWFSNVASTAFRTWPEWSSSHVWCPCDPADYITHSFLYLQGFWEQNPKIMRAHLCQHALLKEVPNNLFALLHKKVFEGMIYCLGCTGR